MFSERTPHLRMQLHHQKGWAWVPTQVCKPAPLDLLLNISSSSYQPHHNFCFGREQVLNVGPLVMETFRKWLTSQQLLV